MILVTYPEKIVSEANQREHWRPKAARAKLHRVNAWAAMRQAGGFIGAPELLGPLRITMTRIAPRELDSDNLASGFKASRDGVADWLGIDDGDKRLTWEYQQRKGMPKQYAVEIRVEGVA